MARVNMNVKLTFLFSFFPSTNDAVLEEMKKEYILQQNNEGSATARI